MDFPPISKDFDSQGKAASRAAHFPHILRASRQVVVVVVYFQQQHTKK